MPKRKHNPYQDKQQMEEAMEIVIRTLQPYPFPYIKGQVSTLGGIERPTILLNISLQPKNEWVNGIYQNSPFAQLSIDHKGVVEMFSGCIQPKLRKTHVKSVQEIITKLYTWGEKALKIKI